MSRAFVLVTAAFLALPGCRSVGQTNSAADLAETCDALAATAEAPAIPRRPLWIASRRTGLTRINTTSALAEGVTMTQHRVRGATADEFRERLWTLEGGHLRAYSFQGLLLREIPLPHHDDDDSESEDDDSDTDDDSDSVSDDDDSDNDSDSDSDDDSGRRLAVNVADGSVWTARGSTLFHFDGTPSAPVEPLHVVRAPANVQALSVDPRVSLLYALRSKRRIDVVDTNGDRVRSIGLDRKGRDLNVDANTGNVFVVDKRDGVTAFDAAGTQLFSTPIHRARLVSTDFLGGAWISTKRGARLVDKQGSVLLEIDDVAGRKIVAIAADPFDGSVWIATKHEVLHVSRTGQVLATISLPSFDKAVTVFISSDAPTEQAGLLAFLSRPDEQVRANVAQGLLRNPERRVEPVIEASIRASALLGDFRVLESVLDVLTTADSPQLASAASAATGRILQAQRSTAPGAPAGTPATGVDAALIPVSVDALSLTACPAQPTAVRSVATESLGLTGSGQATAFLDLMFADPIGRDSARDLFLRVAAGKSLTMVTGNNHLETTNVDEDFAAALQAYKDVLDAQTEAN